MKKIIWVFFTSLAFLFVVSTVTYASSCVPRNPALKNALVQCGQYPLVTSTGAIPPAGYTGKLTTTGACPCGFSDIFITIVNAYQFFILYIIFPLAGIMIVAGGIFIMVSGGNPGLASTGKKIVTYAIVGVILILASFVIIDAVLTAIGYVSPTGNWWSF